MALLSGTYTQYILKLIGYLQNKDEFKPGVHSGGCKYGGN